MKIKRNEVVGFGWQKSEGTALPELLWEEQGQFWIDRDRYSDRYPKHFFKEGRDILRQYNSDLNFPDSNGLCGYAIYQVFQGIINDACNTRFKKFDTL